MKTYLLLTVAALAFVTAVMSIVKYIRYTRSAFRELRVLSRHTHRRHRKAPYFRIDGAFAEEPDNVLESEEKYSLFLHNAPEPGDVIVVRYLEGKRFLISPSHLLIQALIRAALGAALVLIAFRLKPNDYLSIGNSGNNATNDSSYSLPNLSETFIVNDDGDIGGIYFNREFAYDYYKKIQSFTKS